MPRDTAVTQLPTTTRDWVRHWKRMGFQHFHLNTMAGTTTARGVHVPYITLQAIFRTWTPVCEDRARCLIVPVDKVRRG